MEKTQDQPKLPRSTLFSQTSYLYGGATALILSWTLATLMTGCKFGNYTATTDNPDKLSGYYDTQAETVKFCATSITGTQCASVATNQVPTLISDEMTSPVALIMQDLKQGFGVFTAYSGGQSALPINVDPDKTLTFVNRYSPSTLFVDPSCTGSQLLEEAGLIVNGTPNSVPGTVRKTSGRVQILIRVTQTIDSQTPGACNATLQTMANCYQDVTQCGGATSQVNVQLQAQLQALVNPYIHAGVLGAADIAHLVNLAYEIQYQ